MTINEELSRNKDLKYIRNLIIMLPSSYTLGNIAYNKCIYFLKKGNSLLSVDYKLIRVHVHTISLQVTFAIQYRVLMQY